MKQRHSICALATPPGTSGLAVIRVSGQGAIEAVKEHFESESFREEVRDHTIQYGWWKNEELRIDAVTATLFVAPNSYTGEDVVEVGCHGGSFVVDQILSSLVSSGVRPADPGEFTKRAFLNGKLDLTQVEAVADLIHSQSTAGAQTAARQLAGGFTKKLNSLRDSLLSASGLLEVELDFSEEGYEFVSREAFVSALDQGVHLATSLAGSAKSDEILRSGFYCAVVGFPNAGKSSLFNALLDRPRAIVSHIPGTTRDYLEESLILGGYTIHLYDTAGLRDTEDSVEMQGIVLTGSLLDQSNLIAVVNDSSLGFGNSDALVADIREKFPETPVIVVQNKMDLVDEILSPSRSDDIACSSIDGTGVEAVREMLLSKVEESYDGMSDVLVNARHAVLLKSLSEYLMSASAALANNDPADLIAIDIRAAIRILGEITGQTWNPDVLDTVFSNFCIGK